MYGVSADGLENTIQWQLVCSCLCRLTAFVLVNNVHVWINGENKEHAVRGGVMAIAAAFHLL